MPRWNGNARHPYAPDPTERMSDILGPNPPGKPPGTGPDLWQDLVNVNRRVPPGSPPGTQPVDLATRASNLTRGDLIRLVGFYPTKNNPNPQANLALKELDVDDIQKIADILQDYNGMKYGTIVGTVCCSCG
jgi:hypothetical protein